MFLQGKEVRFALVLLVLAGLTYAQELKECKNSTDLKNGYVKTTTTPYGSKIITPYKNGKINGVEKLYYKNKILKKETPYKNDKINGFVRGYYENGKPEFILFYTNGKKDKEVV